MSGIEENSRNNIRVMKMSVEIIARDLAAKLEKISNP